MIKLHLSFSFTSRLSGTICLSLAEAKSIIVASFGRKVTLIVHFDQRIVEVLSFAVRHIIFSIRFLSYQYMPQSIDFISSP